MPLYMDRHVFPDAKPQTLADAHQKDLAVEGRYGVSFVTYWFDEHRGTAFCLVQAPTRDAVEQAHRAAHGFVPTAIIDVDSSAVQAFLGRIEDASPSAAGEGEPPREPALRAILFTDMQDSTAMANRLGDARFMDVLRTHNRLIRDAFRANGGREVKHTGDGFMASFAHTPSAVACSIAIQRSMYEYNAARPETPIRVRIGLSVGEPVEEGADLFGVAVTLAARLCQHAEADSICVSEDVRALCADGAYEFVDGGDAPLKGFAAPVRVHVVRWRVG